MCLPLRCYSSAVAQTPGGGRSRSGRSDTTTGGADEAGAVEGGATDLGWALSTILRAYARAADRALGDLPGGSRAYRLLTSVAYDCLPSQLAVAHRVGLDRTVVTYLLDDLEVTGLIERRADPADRRARRVVITPAGAERLADCQRRLGSVEEAVLGELGEVARAGLRAQLDRVARSLCDSDGTRCLEVAAVVADAGCPSGGDCS